MLNERIKELRNSLNLTQVELANDLNVTKQCVSNWENNNIQPSVDMLVKIALYFGVSADYLLGLEQKRLLDVSGLTDMQISHISQLVKDISVLMKGSHT